MKSFGGSVLFLNRSDINTDEIIPAKYLNEIAKADLRPHLFEDLKIPGFHYGRIASEKVRLVASRANFGCGSSREHAPWALEANSITAVIAENFARIFRQNMFNCGMLAIELNKNIIQSLFDLEKAGPLEASVDLDQKRIHFSGEKGQKLLVEFTINPFDEELVRAGGWVEYADKKY